MNVEFQNALHNRSLAQVRKIEKADLHNHCLMGAYRPHIEKYLGKKMTPFRASANGIADLNSWIINNYRPFFSIPGSLDVAVGAAFYQARRDGIKILEMSFDVMFGRRYNISPGAIVQTLKQKHGKMAPDIDFRPEIGISRNLSMRGVMAAIDPFFDLGYFCAIDLYDDELAQPVANFKELYRYAKRAGMRCKAHAGEFGSADSVKEAVETLELDAVQHGIAAAGSAQVMRWLAEHKTVLNVCPASNIRLRLARNYKSHPIRILYDHGVKVTVNSDDALVFRDGVSEQFLKLFKSGVFSENELDEIRRNGLIN